MLACLHYGGRQEIREIPKLVAVTYLTVNVTSTALERWRKTPFAYDGEASLLMCTFTLKFAYVGMRGQVAQYMYVDVID